MPDTAHLLFHLRMVQLNVSQHSQGQPKAKMRSAGPKPISSETDFKGRIKQRSVSVTPMSRSPKQYNQDKRWLRHHGIKEAIGASEQ